MFFKLKLLFWNRYKIKNNSIKRKLAFLSIEKKNKFTKLFVKNFLKIKVWTNKFYCITIKKKKKNLFANYSTLFGKNFKLYSSGMFSKSSLKRTFFAFNVLLEKIYFDLLKIKKKFFLLNVLGNANSRGLKKNIKIFLQKRKLKNKVKFFQISNLKFKSHNGVRLKSLKRK